MNFREAFGKGRFISSIDIMGEEFSTMILSAEKRMVDNPKTGEKDELLVLGIYGQADFICNKTNFKSIAFTTGEKDTEGWIGRVIKLAALPYKRSESGYAIRVLREPEDREQFVRQAHSKDELKKRIDMLNGDYKEAVIKQILKEWQTRAENS